MQKELELLALFGNVHKAAWPYGVYVDSSIISDHISQMITQKKWECIIDGEAFWRVIEANLSSNVVLAAEFTKTSTSSAITLDISSSSPRLCSQILPTTGTSLLNIKAWYDFPWIS